VLGNKKMALHVVNSVSPRFVERPGGYTTLIKMANRKGDNAEQVIVQFVE
jgi:large subunit ribosomal protein L17